MFSQKQKIIKDKSAMRKKIFVRAHKRWKSLNVWSERKKNYLNNLTCYALLRFILCNLHFFYLFLGAQEEMFEKRIALTKDFHHTIEKRDFRASIAWKTCSIHKKICLFLNIRLWKIPGNIFFSENFFLMK